MENALQIQKSTDVVERLATQYGTTREKFYGIVKATCKMEKATNEQFQTFLMIAEKYNLNPITKQMWAFPDRNGGIMTMVALDGWINIVNNHAQFDGYETSVQLDDKDKPISATCKMYRKDRKHAITKTIYVKEWIKTTSPVWQQMPIHFAEMRAYIQCARMAFNIDGIYDADVQPLDFSKKYPEAIKTEGYDKVTGEVIDVVEQTNDDEFTTEDYKKLIANTTTLDGINGFADLNITDPKLRVAIHAKATELGFMANKELGKYVKKENN